VVDSFQAVAVVLLALLPGALYTWGFEREAGQWGVGLADRFLRFVGLSAVLHVAFAPVTWWLWRHYVESGRLDRGDLPRALWPVLVAYVAVPVLAGHAVGRDTRRGRPWARRLTGGHPSPTAWEHFFGHDPEGTLRLKLKSGKYIAGVYMFVNQAEKSYAAAFPHDPLDLWLVRGVAVDAETGAFQFAEDGSPVTLDSGILVRYDEVEFLEYFPSPAQRGG
jgi:hypothetical protein